MVNGAQIERSAVLFQGDRVRTGSPIASLEFSGSAVLMAKDSTAVLEANQLALILRRRSGEDTHRYERPRRKFSDEARRSGRSLRTHSYGERPEHRRFGWRSGGLERKANDHGEDRPADGAGMY